ncbi:hypothetical protein ACFWOX_05900 [Streptomyces sp. NPDC058467]|uniref:hypothetical protein n=1 Tax=Streptomyces sp. NPDC058467 TaxID=3346513 RepID=UPI003661C772
MNIRHAALAATAICALTTAGCGASHSQKPALTPVAIGGLPHTLVGEDYNSVTLIETTTQDGNITGTFDTTEIRYNSPEHLRATLTGTVKGSQVTLKASFTLGSTVLNGTLDGNTLTLQVPQQNGQIEDYVLKPGTVDDYNQRVSQLENGGSPSPTAQPSKFY